MIPNAKFKNQSPEFWANIKLLNQRLGYTKKPNKTNPAGGFVIPTKDNIKKVFIDEGLDYSKLINSENEYTELGNIIIEYIIYRSEVLSENVQNLLMDKHEAKELFYSIKESFTHSTPLPYNKQKDEKRDFAYLTGIVNMLITKYKGDFDCDFDPKELTAITQNGFPVRTLSRRLDGAFPSVINPKAVWEIKEYYYTTTFGSRVADGVYETQLDGWELLEVKNNLGIEIKHYLIVDDKFTWWVKGRSYLCRLIDSMHMGLVDEVIFGKEVISRIPELVMEWKV
ncbi:hypothetical protein SAMN05421846_1112 [Chryseobacterium taeanense]|uniref:Uncharacterized protein n=1 Tax=Chryseobacterium taeanense TaxID=311334 RepID=A0A1G8M643_9FLAO|nr:hypothetical protein [Chryseobacterium taeanense]SDI63408.1 hypothetical protein SAMN05421846_1112 [Chryseobacterium taeanense]